MPSVPDSSRVLDVSIRRRMPHPVASVWHRVSLAIGPVAQREELLRTVPALLRTVALFQLPDYLRGPPVDVVERLLRALERPSDGHWLHLARGLAKAAHERAEPAPFMPEAYAWLLDERGKPTGAARAVEEFIALRNSLRHGRSAAGEAEERERLLQVRERARDVLDRVQWLAGYRPFRVVEQQPTTTPGTFSGRVQMWVGSRELVEPEAATWRAWLVPGRVYVAAPSGRAFLDVDPLLQVLPHPTAKRELLFAFADAPRLKRMRLTHDGSGGEREVAPVLDEREVTFEAWLAARGRAGVAIDDEGDPEVFADPASARSALAGEVLDGRYEIRGVLGEGGTATVYRVWDREFEQEVALKVLHRDLGQDERFCERFRREGRLMARVEHPHLLRVLDLGELVDGRLFLKTPLAAGGSLRDFVGSAPGDATLRRWMRQALGALVALHSAGVVHRDLKPSNLLIDEDGDLMVGDFGVALDPSQRRLTQNLERLGSPAYMAPEQAAQTTVTTAADLYSLAVIWHELLAGSLPDGRPGDGIAAPWSSLLRSLGARAAGERPTASEALSRLDDRGAAVAATPAPAVSEVARGEREASEVTDPTRPTPSASARGASAERPTERSRPRRWPVLISVLVGLGAVVAVGLLLVRSGNQPDRDQAAEASGPDETGAGGAVRPARVIGQDGATLVLVPGTTFGLGLSTAEQVRHRAACQATGSERCNRPGYFDNETPETPVEVSAFYLDRAEVSRAQYAVCVSAGACPPIDEAECQVYDGHDWGAGRQLAAASLRPEVPRTCVMREEAAAYCRWAERRLPTEAEWELAAAGTEGRVFPWGDVFDASRAAFLDQGPQVLVGPDERSSGATSSGIVHLAGNAYEWVADDACDYESRPRGRDPVCHALRERGVVRGGSFLSSGVSLRTSFRRFTSTNSRADNIGFRCAIGASEAERL